MAEHDYYGTPTRRKRGLAAAFLLPLVLLLSGCVKMDMGITLYEDNTADVEMTLIDKSGMILGSGMGGSCDELAAEMGEMGGDGQQVEEITDDDGRNGCRISESGIAIDSALDTASAGGGLAREGDIFILDAPPFMEDDQLEEMPGAEVSLSLTFPGEVIEAGEGTVSDDGRTVTFSGAAISQDIYATGSAVPSGISWALIAVIVVGVIAAVALIVLVVKLRSRSRKPATVGYPPYQGQDSPDPLPPHGSVPSPYTDNPTANAHPNAGQQPYIPGAQAPRQEPRQEM